MSMNPLIPKGRKPKFELSLRIYDLNNVPLVAGTSHVRWNLPTSNAAEHRGRTEQATIKDNRVTWDYSKTIPVRVVIDKINNLTETILHLEVIQDYSGGGRGEKIILGEVRLNLAEYVEESESADSEDGVVRRYLMQESKINSTLKIGIAMKQIDGDRNFVAPALKTVPVFGGIAGIMAGEQAKPDDRGAMPTISKGGDQNDLQDLYRQSVAASLSAPVGEFTAEECIEDIFNGGDGWKGGWSNANTKTPYLNIAEDQVDGRSEYQARHSRNKSDSSLKSQSTIKGHTRMSHKHSSRDMSSTSLNSQDGHTSSGSSERGRPGFRKAREVDEFDMREDLIAWKLPGVVSPS